MSGAEGAAATTMGDLFGAWMATLSKTLTGIPNVGLAGAFAMVIGLRGLVVVWEVCAFFLPGGTDPPSAERVRWNNAGHCKGDWRRGPAFLSAGLNSFVLVGGALTGTTMATIARVDGSILDARGRLDLKAFIVVTVFGSLKR